MDCEGAAGIIGSHSSLDVTDGRCDWTFSYNLPGEGPILLTRIYSSLTLACLLAGAVYAADDPFVGKWKFNQEKSNMTGIQMKIEDLGDNKYKITMGGTSDTITADGTDQPMQSGETEAITKQGPNTWKGVDKRDGKVTASFTETLSEDGNSLSVKGTTIKPDGSSSEYTGDFKRVGTGSGWAGTWRTSGVKYGVSSGEWDIEPYEGNGLTFKDRAYQETLSMKFDGKEYAKKGPDVSPGSTSSGKRLNARTLELTDKVKDKVTEHATYEISPDGQTLTITARYPGQPSAQTYVYERM